MPFQPKGISYLFVYGTLMRDDASLFDGAETPMAAFLAEHAQFVDEGSLPGTLYHLGEFPGLVLGDQQIRRVHGEVFQLGGAAEDVLRALDDYEDCADDNGPEGLYSRVKTPIRLRNGAHVDAWTYVYNQDVSGARMMLDGRWRGRE